MQSIEIKGNVKTFLFFLVIPKMFFIFVMYKQTKTKIMTDLNKYTKKFGDIENGFYTVKTAVRNPKGELFVNYVQYIDDKKVSLQKHNAWIDAYGDIETLSEPCYRKSYSTNH